MTVPLSPDQRQRLAKLLGMLGSVHSGERDAAGLAAHRLVVNAGMTWQDVLVLQVEHHQPEPDAWSDGYAEQARPAEWRNIVDQCLKFPTVLTQWETQFLRDIRHRRRLTPRQREVLGEIADRVLNRSAHHQSERRR